MLGPGPSSPRGAPPPRPPALSAGVLALLTAGAIVPFGTGAGAVALLVALASTAAEAPAHPDHAPGAATADEVPPAPSESPAAANEAPPPRPRDDDSSDDEAPDDAREPRPPAPTTSTKPMAPRPSGAAGGASWWCTASASVRVCGFAGACTYQMVFGNGASNDRFLASQQAKSACEASARARGAVAACVVQCSPRAAR